MIQQKTIYELWASLISRKGAGTARSYQDALSRFQKDNGTRVRFEEITPEFIDHWRNVMRANLSKTTTNIYLRSFSAVVHFAYELQLISTPPKFLFRGLGIFSPHGSNSRKHCYLPASEWLRIWEFYLSRGRKNTVARKWRKDYRERYLEAVGLMLFMYLAGGMNLRDLCMLRYDKFYFTTGGKQIQFCRHKTAERTNTTVELPVLPEMKIIMERQGQICKEGMLIFPYLNKVIGDDGEEHKYTALLGHAVRDRMRTVAKALRIPMLTPTWARHSFATNLIHAGVPKDYVAWAMAHTSRETTSIYIASYSFEQMVEYNSLLLHPRGGHAHIISQFELLSEEEREKLLQKLLRDRK